MSDFLTLIRNHARAAFYGFVLIAIVASIWGAHMAGQHEQATLDAESADHVRDSTEAANTARLKSALSLVRDSGLAMVRAQVKIDSTASASRIESATRVDSAKIVRSQTVIDTASVTIKTDTGLITLPVPPLVAVTWNAERKADTDAIASLQASLRADAVSLAERDARLKNDSSQFALRDSVDASLTAQIKAKSADLAKAQRAGSPSFISRAFSALKYVAIGFVGGAIAVVAR